MKTLASLGRFIFAIPFLFVGAIQFLEKDVIVKMMPDFIPIPEAFVYFSGLALILAAVAIILNLRARLACQLLAALFLLIILVIHLPNVIEDKSLLKWSSVAMLKDIALMGAALTYSGILKK